MWGKFEVGFTKNWLMITDHYRTWEFDEWSGWRDSNSRHPAPKAGALPDCATPRKEDLDPFSVKHFETNIFFCKCFTAVRSTFDNLWCREGDSNPHNLTVVRFWVWCVYQFHPTTLCNYNENTTFIGIQIVKSVSISVSQNNPTYLISQFFSKIHPS